MQKKEKGNFFTTIRKSSNFGIFIALVVMMIIFTVLKSTYLSRANVFNILVSCSVVGLVVTGEALLAISGQADLSCGSVSAFSGVLIAILLKAGFPMVPSVIFVLVIGGCIGLFNAFLITKLNINYFITTLATQSIFRGLAYIICNGKSIAITHSAFLKIGTTRIFGVLLPVYIFLIIFAGFAVILVRTRFGRSIYMVGGNSAAARLAGIQAKKIITLLFSLTSMLAALGGVVLASRMNSGQPSASKGLEFDALTSCILGGIAMGGGVGNMTGALIGLFVMQGFANGLAVLNVQSFWQEVASGLLLIVALTFDYVRNKNREKEIMKRLMEQ